ncbi:MAG: peptidoglycan-binding protein [Acidimicrobiales bacterium]
MAEIAARRVVAIAAIAGALVGGVVAGGVAVATAGSTSGATSSSGASGSTDTAAVVRTTLTTSVQEGGSIGFQGSYTITAPSGTSAQQLLQARQAVAEDQQNLSADERAESDAATTDNQATAESQTGVDTAQSTLGSDETQKTQDCGGSSASGTACSSDTQKVDQDQTQLTQAQQQLTDAQGSAARDHDAGQAKIQSDQTALLGDEAALASAQQNATNPGTTYTALPGVGAVIGEDQAVYALSNQPVPLLYGSVPSYRACYVGMSDGPDVGELTADLMALGYGSGLTQSDHYSSATEGAVERWQRALGLPATGEILLGDVVFEPGPIRVTAVSTSVGTTVGGGGGGGNGGAGGTTVLAATSTTPIVTVDLDVSQEYLVKPGDDVTVVLPNGTSNVGGRIETVGSVASCPSGGDTGSGTGAPTGSSSASTSTCSSGGSGTDAGPTVPVTVTLDSTPPGSTLDEAPVNVDITTQKASNVLAVPVNALLAVQGGGYGVEVVTHTTSRLVGVTTGLYADNMVQVSGTGVRVGMRVQVPSS